MASKIPDLDLYHPWDLDASSAIDLALQMEAAARDYDNRISNTGGANINRGQGLSLYCNSHEFNGIVAASRHSVSCSVIAGEGAAMQRDYAYSASRIGGPIGE